MSKARAAAAASLFAFTSLAAATAGAEPGEYKQPKPEKKRVQVFSAELEELNDSGATGHVRLRLRGNQLTVRINARGLEPNLVHAQHIHGVGNSECPPPDAAGADGVLSTADGLPFYGPIVSSLTTAGDTSPAAGLDIEVMPVADSKGRVRYTRTITVPDAVAANLEAFQVVQHGVDFNDNDVYDFSAGPSELDPAFPQEATAPANCGTISHRGHNHSH